MGFFFQFTKLSQISRIFKDSAIYLPYSAPFSLIPAVRKGAMRRIAGDSIRVVICDFAIFRHENPELPQPYEHSNQSSPRHTEYKPLIERKDQSEASDKYDSQRNQYRHELEMLLAIVKSEPTDLGHRHGSHIYPGYPFIKPTVHHRSDNAIKHS